MNTPPELFKEYLNYLDENDYKVIALRNLLTFIDFEEAKKAISPNLNKKYKN